MFQFRLIWAFVALLLVMSDSIWADPPPRIDLALGDVRVQSLPPAINNVKTGPAGKTWLLIDPPEAWSFEQAKEVVEREFNQAQPQLIGLNLLGFGRNGRAWFIADGWTPKHGEDRLIGYDGESWLEYDNKANVVGQPVVIGEDVLFPGRSGVAILDSKGWRRELGLNGTTYPAQIVADPGQASAVVQFGSDNKLYRYRDGQMVPLHDGSGIKGDIKGLISCRFGVFAYFNKQLIPLALPTDAPGYQAMVLQLEELLAQLAKAEPAEHNAILDAMVALGPKAAEPIKAKLEVIDNAESRLLLRRVVLRLEQVKADAPAEPAPDLAPQLAGTAIGPYRLTAISFAHPLKTGHMLVGVQAGTREGEDAPLKPGLLVIPPEAEPFYIVDAVVNNCGLQHDLRSITTRPVDLVLPISEHVVRLPGHKGSEVWRSGKGRQTWPANPGLLLNLDKRTLTPDGDEILLGIDAQGRRYVAQGDWAHRLRFSAIDVITPDAPDDRQFLDLPEPTHLDTRSHGWGGHGRGAAAMMDSQGHLYVLAKDGPLQRYDGKNWHDIPGTQQARASQLLLISRTGAVVFQSNTDARLVVGDEVYEAKSIRELVEQQHEQFAEHFKGGSLPTMMAELGQIIADDQGNIWLRKRHLVSIYDGKQWIEDIDDRVKKSDENSRYRFMASVDGGSKIYITNLIHNPPLAYYASLRDGVINKVDAPHGQPADPTIREIRDGSGALWVANASRVTNGWERHALRVVPGEEPLRIRSQGSPVLTDGGGNLVLYKGAMGRPQHRMLNLVRDGKVVHSLAVPQLGHSAEIASDGPGSIYVIGGRGLIHLTAEQPQQHPYDYAQSAFYHIDAPGQLVRLFASPLGFVAMIRQDQKELFLHVLDLPLKPRPPLIEQLRAEVKKVLDAYSGRSASDPLKAKLGDYSPEVQVLAMLPYVDYSPNQGVLPVGNQVIVQRMGELWEASLPHVLTMFDDEQASRRIAAAMIVDDMRFLNQGRDEMPWMASTGPKLAALLADDPSVKVRIEAARALADFDEQAAPYAKVLIAALDDEDKQVRQMSLSALRQVGPDTWSAIPLMIKILQDPGSMRRDAAAEALMHMGDAATEAVPAILEMLGDPNVVDAKLYASNALYWIEGVQRQQIDPKTLARAIRHGEYGGPAYLADQLLIDDLDVVVALAESLDVQDGRDSYNAYTSASALINIKPDNKAVLAYLHDLAKSNRPFARVLATVVYANLIDDHAWAVPRLRAIHASAVDKDEREEVVTAMRMLGPDAVELLSLARPNTGDRFPWTALQTIQSRWTLAGQPDEHIAWVAKELHHRSTNSACDDAAKTLGLLGPMADAQVPAITEVLDQFVPFASYNRWHAVNVLRGIGPTDNTRLVLPQLKRLLDPEVEPSAYNRRIVAEAIWSISRETDVVVSALTEVLDDRGRSFFFAAAALGRMGSDAAQAIPRLEQATSDPNPHYREAAAKALKAIRMEVPNDPPDEQDFLAWYQDLGDTDDQAATDATWQFAKAGASARDFLINQTRMLSPQKLEKINQTLQRLTEEIDMPPRAMNQLDAHEQIQAALKAHLQALFEEDHAVQLGLNRGGLTVQINLAARLYPHRSLEENRRHARAMQALDLIDRASKMEAEKAEEEKPIAD